MLTRWGGKTNPPDKYWESGFTNSHCLRCSFAEWQRLTEVFPAKYLSRSQGEALHDLALQCCHFWYAAAWEACNQQKLRWLILPKMHLFHHMALDCKRHRYNVRGHHCFSQEDFYGDPEKNCAINFHWAKNGRANPKTGFAEISG